MRRFYFSLALAGLLAGTLWASGDPICAKWKLNEEKSKFAGELIKIQDLGGNKYKWTVGNITDTIPYVETTSKRYQTHVILSAAKDPSEGCPTRRTCVWVLRVWGVGALAPT